VTTLKLGVFTVSSDSSTSASVYFTSQQATLVLRFSDDSDGESPHSRVTSLQDFCSRVQREERQWAVPEF